MKKIRATQHLNSDLATVWTFISSPKNLPLITPPAMALHVKGPEPDEMYAGQIIEYKLKPPLGIPMRWVTEITHVRTPDFFL